MTKNRAGFATDFKMYGSDVTKTNFVFVMCFDNQPRWINCDKLRFSGSFKSRELAFQLPNGKVHNYISLAW